MFFSAPQLKRDSLGSRLDPVPLVENAPALTKVFGKWPTFHDAEVLRIVLDRAGDDGPTIEVQIHVFAMTSRVDESGHYVLENHRLVTLRFTEVELLGMAWINRQNVLEELIISDLDPLTHDGRNILVELVTSYGVGATLECKRALVLDVQPFEAAT